jgi:hypothetical protein
VIADGGAARGAGAAPERVEAGRAGAGRDEGARVDAQHLRADRVDGAPRGPERSPPAVQRPAAALAATHAPSIAAVLLGASAGTAPVRGATLVASEATELRARVTSRTPLRYSDGADPALDRPANVRAGSGLAWLGDQLVLVQDDASFVALHDPKTGRTVGVPLPPGPDGRRVFDEAHGNKATKLDLEAIATLSRSPPVALAFGSGSGPGRETIVVVEPCPTGAGDATVTPVRAPRLYAALRANTAFAGSELNVEGVAEVGDRLRFFQRGNGATLDGRAPVDATIDVSTDALLAFLEDPEHAPVPELLAPTRFELGALRGVRLTFNDAATDGDRVLFLAGAEATADVVEDGEVQGSVLGVIDAEGRVRWARLVDEHGAPLVDKPEGLCLDPRDPSRLYAVTDRDDATKPAELLTIELA